MRLRMATTRLPQLKLLSHVEGGSPTAIPRLVYGTAWKKDATAGLVSKAIVSGFRGVDTACQPRHYQENLVGEGIEDGLKKTGLKREDIFIQTKYTPISGQDPSTAPYDAKASIRDQVNASVSRSLENLRVSKLSTINREPDAPAEEPYIDCVLMHSPCRTVVDTLDAWDTLSKYVPKTIRHIGFSNITLPLLKHIYEHELFPVKPSVVQNRFYEGTGYDVPLRRWCREQGIIFQSFWTLSGNPDLVNSDLVQEVAEKIGIENEVALYALVWGLEGTCVLDGTTKEEHMVGDLDGLKKVHDFIGKEENKEIWDEWIGRFGDKIGEKEEDPDVLFF